MRLQSCCHQLSRFQHDLQLLEGLLFLLTDVESLECLIFAKFLAESFVGQQIFGHERRMIWLAFTLRSGRSLLAASWMRTETPQLSMLWQPDLKLLLPFCTGSRKLPVASGWPHHSRDGDKCCLVQSRSCWNSYFTFAGSISMSVVSSSASCPPLQFSSSQSAMTSSSLLSRTRR